jgi:PAS domain S-box-containing protein
MSPEKRSYNLAIVGAGRQGMAILEALVPTRKMDQLLREQPLHVVGVADLNPNAPGIIYANRFNLLVTVNFVDFFNLPDLDIIVNATGRSEVSQQLREQAPGNLMVLNVDRPFFSWEDFWDLIPVELSSIKEVAPLRIGIVGGGRGGHEVLQLLAGNQSYKRRIEILGVADPNPLAQGMILAKSMGIPTFDDYGHLLQEDPDLILELTGELQVREGLIRQKQPHTQIIDHIKARLFWELLRREEDRLRNKVESEIKLGRQRSRFHRIFDHLPDPVLVLLSNYTVDEVNLTFLNRFQKKEAEVVGQPCYKVLHKFDEPCEARGLTCPMARVLESCQTVQVFHQCLGPDDKTHCNEITMSPLFPPEATQKRVVEVIKDITPRRKLEVALEQSQSETQRLLKEAITEKAFLETIVNGIKDHMMVIDLDYRIVEVNRALLEMVGLAREDVVGKHCYEVSHHLQEPCASPDHPCPLKKTVATGKTASAIHVHFDKNGRESYLHVVCHPLFDEEGRIRGVVDLSRDITQEISRTRMMHEDKIASLGKLSASVVHEINNPLTGILSSIRVIKRVMEKESPGQEELRMMKKHTDIVYNEIFRVGKTVSSLLPFSRTSKPEFKPVDLNTLLAETLALAEYQMRLQGITVEARWDPNLLQVRADPGKMKQVFLNLLLNAQEAMPKDGTLTLVTRNTRRREVLVLIADTGMGIPKEKFSQIFEPFYTTKAGGLGAGLGLSVVCGIIGDHQGVISVHSVVGRGTCFAIRLPAYKWGENHVAS